LTSRPARSSRPTLIPASMSATPCCSCSSEGVRRPHQVVAVTHGDLAVTVLS
jgi:hypothetical protein